MIILTDTPQFCRHLTGIRSEWQQVKARSDQSLPHLISLFNVGGKVFTAYTTNYEKWNYLYVVDHARASQFETLLHLLRSDHEVPDKFLCIAQTGESFKGYNNRTWIAEKGNLHLSICLHPEQQVEYFNTGFTILSAVAVLKTIDQISGLAGKCSIKWVNDLVIGEHKVGGVITHTQVCGPRVTTAVLGIGLNVLKQPAVIPDSFVPASAALITYSDTSLNEVFSALVINLLRYYQKLLAGGYDELWQIYVSRSNVVGREVAIFSDKRNRSAECIVRGNVERIGRNLELYLQGHRTPVSRGRLAFVHDL